MKKKFPGSGPIFRSFLVFSAKRFFYYLNFNLSISKHSSGRVKRLQRILDRNLNESK